MKKNGQAQAEKHYLAIRKRERQVIHVSKCPGWAPFVRWKGGENMAEAKNDKAKGNPAEEYSLYGGSTEKFKTLIAKGTKAEMEALQARYWKTYKDARAGAFLEVVKE